jgi:hypothetical protein
LYRAINPRIADDELEVIVPEPDQAEGDGDQQHHPHKTIREISPQQRRRDDRRKNQRTAHRRRACLAQVRLRTVGAHALADLVFGEPADHAWANQQRDRQRRQCCEDRPQGQVLENVDA